MLCADLQRAELEKEYAATRERALALHKEEVRLLQQKLTEAETQPTASNSGQEQTISELREELAASAAKLDEVKNKAKKFVREKLATVQTHLKSLEERHAEFTMRLAVRRAPFSVRIRAQAAHTPAARH